MAGPDTIFALATAPGPGAVAIIRVSGPAAGRLGAGLLGGALPPPRLASLRTLRDPAGAELDQALVLWMPGPRSFTGEDVLELHTHGGRVVPARVMAALAALGGRPAGPGEFTRRAFLAGRIGLDQAEAVDDLIRAESAEVAGLALGQLQGGLRARIESARRALVELLAHQHATLDFPEEDVDDLPVERVAAALAPIRRDLEVLAASFARGQMLREGVRVALFGRPNVGKSSLLNALLGVERALVTEEAGTTRDVLEEALEYRGRRYVLVDTAGRRETAGLAEGAGVARGIEAVAEAGIRVLVTESGSLPTAEESAWLAGLRPDRDLWVRSKADRTAPGADRGVLGLPLAPRWTAAPTGEGIGELMEAIHARGQALAPSPRPGEVVVTRLRHRQALDTALGELAAFEAGLRDGLPPDVAMVELSSAVRSLGAILGEVGAEEVLDALFARFCLGK